MINGICISSEEGFGSPHDWPQEFMALPRVGDGIRKNKSMETMHITGIIHEMFEGKPRIIIRLSKN